MVLLLPAGCDSAEPASVRAAPYEVVCSVSGKPAFAPDTPRGPVVVTLVPLAADDHADVLPGSLTVGG